MKFGVIFLFLFAIHAFAISTNVIRLKVRDSHLIFDDKLNSKEIAITFAGKFNEKTFPLILKKLDDAKIRAHFFLNGDSAVERAEYVYELASRSHVIGSQGFSLARSKEQDGSMQSVLNEIQQGHEAVFATLGFVYPFIRLAPRQGSIAVRDLIKESGAFAFYWNIDYYPENPAQSIRDNLKREGYRGIVSLPLHREDALQALDSLIEEIKNEDLTVVTILPSEESSWAEVPPLIRKSLREEIQNNGSVYKRKYIDSNQRWL